MKSATRTHRTYDHRLKRIVRSTGSIRTAIDAGVPTSTARGWLSSPEPAVVSVPAELEATVEELRGRIVVLERRNERLLAILRLVVVLLKVSEFTLHRRRVPVPWKSCSYCEWSSALNLFLDCERHFSYCVCLLRATTRGVETPCASSRTSTPALDT